MPFNKSGRSRRHGKPNRHPLRKIVGYDDEGLEILECGHHQWPRQDFVGEVPAERRRCRQCGRSKT